MVFRDEINLRPDQDAVFNCDAAHVQKRTGVINEHVFADRDKPSEIGVERREVDKTAKLYHLKRSKLYHFSAGERGAYLLADCGVNDAVF